MQFLVGNALFWQAHANSESFTAAYKQHLVYSIMYSNFIIQTFLSNGYIFPSFFSVVTDKLFSIPFHLLFQITIFDHKL